MVFFCLTSSNLGRIIAQPRGDTTQVQLLYQLATDGFGYSSLILLWKMLDRFSGGTTTNSSATGSGATGSGVTNSSMTTGQKPASAKFVLCGGTLHVLFMFVILASSSYVEVAPSGTTKVRSSVAGFTMCVRIFEELVRRVYTVTIRLRRTALIPV